MCFQFDFCDRARTSFFAIDWVGSVNIGEFFWVERDPLESVDALGMQVVVDDLADRFLPGLSVLTRRAGYFSFLCWARDRANGRHLTREIHRWEVALSAAEGCAHTGNEITQEEEDDDGRSTRCSFLGRRYMMRPDKVPRNVPRNPDDVYVTPAWLQYRASMVTMGLLDPSAGWALAETGQRLAQRYARRVPRVRIDRPLPPTSLLCRIPRRERRALADLLIGHDTSQARTRAELKRSCGRRLLLGVGELLESAYQRPRGEIGGALAAASVWETLSQGLHGLFLGWLASQRRGELRVFERALRRPTTRRPSLVDAWPDVVSETTAMALGFLRRALARRSRLPSAARALLETSMAEPLWNLAENALARRETALDALGQRHVEVKGDSAWVSFDGRAWRRPAGDRRAIPERPSFHTYRLVAFRSLLRDLGRLQ